MIEKRQKIQDKIIKVIDTLDPSLYNHKRYEDLFSSMPDQKFTQYMKDLGDKKTKLMLFTPNMKIFIQQEDCVKAAELLGLKLFERLRFVDKVTGKSYLTPYEYLVVVLPVRRTRQFLMHKLSVAESDKKLDALTGQVTKPDKASALSLPEAQLLYARGLNHTLTEFMKVRGGDIHAFSNFKQQLEENGQVQLESLDPNTISRSTVTMSVVLKCMGFDNNFIPGDK